MAPGTFEIEGPEYWDRPVRTSERVVHAFALEGRSGLFLDAPAEADVDRVDRIPLLVLHAASTQDAQRYDPWRVGHLVCARLEDRSLEVIDLFERSEATDLFDDDADDAAPQGPGGSVVTDQTDALRLAPLGQAGTCMLTALVLDRASNRVTIRVSRSTPGSAAGPAPPPEPIRPAPGQSRDGSAEGHAAPELAAPQRLALACAPVVHHAPGATAWLRGTVCVPALAGELVPAPPAEGDDGFGQPRPSAIVRVCLVVIGSSDGDATTIPIEVPCFGAAPVLPGVPVTGVFAIDLFQHPTLAGRAQTLFVRAFCGEAMTGPTRMAVVADDLPRDHDPSRPHEQGGG